MKYNIGFIIVVLVGMLLSSCGKPYEDVVEVQKFMSISMKGAQDNPIMKELDVDETFTYPISVFYSGTTDYNQGNIVATIGTDDDNLVEEYNSANSTFYLPFPKSALSLDKTELTIADGSKMSDKAMITIDPSEGVDLAGEYLIPITIKSIEGGNLPINEDFKTIYLVVEFKVNSVPSTEDWTLSKVSSVWDDDFKAENIWDGDKNSIWHSEPLDENVNGMPQWVEINLNDYVLIEGFTWTNRQDPGQDALPKHVVFETSLDGNTWDEVLDVPELAEARTMQVLELGKKVVAKYLRITVESNWDDAPYTYIADISTWAGEKPTGEYDWEMDTWDIEDYSSQWNEGMGAQNAIDGDPTTTWHTEPFDEALNGMPQWLIIDMKKERPAIKGFKIWNRQDDHGMEPKHVIFSVSDDLSDWTTILDLEEMSSDADEELDYATENSVSGRYLKIEVQTNWGNGDWTYFGEITPY